MSQVFQEKALKIYSLLQNQSQVEFTNDTAQFEQACQKIIAEQTHDLKETDRKVFVDEFINWGPLEELLSDEELSEIIINSWDSIWVERHGQMTQYKSHFLCEATYLKIFHKICEQFQINLNLQTPHACATWKNLRLTACISPLSSQPCLNIRRHRKLHLTLPELESMNMLDKNQTLTLQSLLQNKESLLIIGSTGSGKTTLLNACLNSIGNHERALLIEDTPELDLPNKASTRLIARQELTDCYQPISIGDLVKISLRMRPDRLVVGEIRGEEAKDLLMAVSSGHKGSLCTLHADSAQQALIRLEMLIQLGAPQWSLEAIRQLIYLSIRAIVLVERDKEGLRQVSAIHRLAGLEKFGILLEAVT